MIYCQRLIPSLIMFDTYVGIDMIHKYCWYIDNRRYKTVAYSWSFKRIVTHRLDSRQQYTSICVFWHLHRVSLYTRILQSPSYLNSKQENADTISEILLRAAREPEFRNQLIKQPSNVLEQYNISDEAKSMIKNSILDLTQ